MKKILNLNLNLPTNEDLWFGCFTLNVRDILLMIVRWNIKCFNFNWVYCLNLNIRIPFFIYNNDFSFYNNNNDYFFINYDIYLLYRAILFGVVEDFLANFGMEGKPCLLRAICEVHAHPLTNFGLVGEMIKLFFSLVPHINILKYYRF